MQKEIEENIESTTAMPTPEPEPKKRGRPVKPKPPPEEKIKKEPTVKQLAYWKTLKERNSKIKKVVEEPPPSASDSSSSSEEEIVVTKKRKKALQKPVLKRTFASIPIDTDSSDESSDGGFSFA
jgi:hypothetical protein